MTITSILREEFRLKHIWLSFPYQEPFFACQWKSPFWLFVVWRLIICLYTLAACLHYLIDRSAGHNPMVYLTTWSYVVLTIHFLVAFACSAWAGVRSIKRSTVADDKKKDSDGLQKGEEINSIKTEPENTFGISDAENQTSSNRIKPLPWYLNVSWLLANVISDWAIIVSVIYYTALFQGSFPPADVNVHMMNSVVILIDTLMVARPVRLLHVIYPMIYGVAYAIVNVSYWSVDPDNNVIYPGVIDWNSPGLAVGILLGMAFVVLPLLQFLYFGIYRLKLCCFKNMYGHSYVCLE